MGINLMNFHTVTWSQKAFPLIPTKFHDPAAFLNAPQTAFNFKNHPTPLAESQSEFLSSFYAFYFDSLPRGLIFFDEQFFFQPFAPKCLGIVSRE